MDMGLIEDIRSRSEHEGDKWLFISLGFPGRRAHVFKLKNNSYLIAKVKDEW